MGSEWGAETTVGQLIADFGGSVKTGPFGTTLKASEYVSEGVPLISVREIGHGSFHVDSKTPRVSSDTTARLSEYLLEEGDIVFARKGGIERCSLVRRKQSGWFLGSDGIRLRPPKNCDARFLAYSLQTQSVKKWLIQHSTGSTMASLNQATISRLPVRIPAIGRQIEIADCLSALDDRITLLRETSVTLEAISQALFKSWFVDFDPVRAKQEGRAPEGMDDATAALFPHELGSWPTRKVAQLINDGTLMIGDGYRAKNSELGLPGVAFVRAGDLKEGRIVPTRDHLKVDSASKAPGKAAIPGDTVFTSKGTIGRFAFVAAGSGGAIYSPQVCFWRSLDCKELTPEFLHFWMKSPSFTQQVKAVQGQAAIMDFVSLTSQREMLVDIPPIVLQQRFSQVGRTLLERIAENREATETISTLRDTLLPRLISGQLRLPEAEAIAS